MFRRAAIAGRHELPERLPPRDRGVPNRMTVQPRPLGMGKLSEVTVPAKLHRRSGRLHLLSIGSEANEVRRLG